MTILRIILLSAVFTIIPASYGISSSTDIRVRIQDEIERFLQQKLASRDGGFDTNISVQQNEIDERIQIPDCEAGFEYSVNEESLGQPYLSIRVNCRSSDWYLFTSAQVVTTRQVVVASSILSPGTVLNSDNLIVREMDVNSLRHTPFVSAESLIGAKLKRRIRAGSPILPNMLCFICKGDRITIVAQAAGMQVKTAGIAQQDGVVGDSIQVVNANSKKAVIAQVANTQTVVVNL